METTKNLYQRLITAKAEVNEAKLQKIQSKELKYPYLPVSAMKPIVSKAETAAGIIRMYGMVEVEEVRDSWVSVSQYNGNETTWMHWKMKLEVILVNCDEPSDYRSMVFVGEAKDNSDKIVNKLYTSAIKNYFKMVYDIAESEEDDTDMDLKQDIVAQAKADPFFGKKTDPPKEQVKATPPPVKAATPVATSPTPAPIPAQAQHTAPATPKHDTPFESAISYNRDGGMAVGRAGSAIEELRKAYTDPTKKKIIEAEMEEMGAKSFTDLNVTAARTILDKVEAVQ